MYRFAPGILVAWLVVAAPLGSYAGPLPEAKPSDVGMSAEKLDRIDPAVQQLIDQHKIAGAVVAVARDGKVIKLDAYGFRDIDQQQRMKTDTIFRIFSMSKAITTVAAMMLWEQGRFQLDDPVAKYLPEFAKLTVYVDGDGANLRTQPLKRPMTVRDLMRHTSGLTYGFSGDGAIEKMYRQRNVLDRDQGLEPLMAQLAQIPLKYQPGSRFEYGVSIDVLGRLVEVWSDQSLDEYFAKNIFEPLGMTDTAFSVSANKLGRFATNYGPNTNGGLRPIDLPKQSPYQTMPKLLSGGGGLVSTAGDYMRFCLMLADGGKFNGHRLLKPETLAEMRKNQLPPEATPMQMGNTPRPGVGFGLGYSVRFAADPDEPDSPVGEYRWGGAASTHFWLSPQDDIAVVVLQQQMPFNGILEQTIKPLVYQAVEEKGAPKSEKSQ